MAIRARLLASLVVSVVRLLLIASYVFLALKLYEFFIRIRYKFWALRFGVILWLSGIRGEYRRRMLQAYRSALEQNRPSIPGPLKLGRMLGFLDTGWPLGRRRSE